jgi:hypothetical protein
MIYPLPFQPDPLALADKGKTAHCCYHLAGAFFPYVNYGKTIILIPKNYFLYDARNLCHVTLTFPDSSGRIRMGAY